MPTARNDNEVLVMLLPQLKKAAEFAADEILKLNAEKIQTWVYNKYNPISYKRTMNSKGSFKEAWGTEVKQGGHSVEIEMDYDPKKMETGHPYYDDGEPLITYDAPDGRGRHVSVLDGVDSREYLAEIIYEGLAGDIFGEGKWTKPRNAFKQLDKTLGKGKLATYIEKGMRKAGLKFKVNSRTFPKTVI